MSALHLLRPAAPRTVLGVVKSWFKGLSSEIWESSETLPQASTALRGHVRRPVRVLVADDEPTNLMVISALLEQRGIVPLLAADGGEAVALACELPFDLILMDLQMPVMDGYDATLALRRFETSRLRAAVPVVAYSSATPGACSLATHGLDGSLTKPCTDDELEACLVRWCPTYRPSQPLVAIPRSYGSWQPSSRPSGAGSAWLR